MWISEGAAVGKASIGGVFQGAPDIHFAYELVQTFPVWMRIIGDNSGAIPPGETGGFTLRLY